MKKVYPDYWNNKKQSTKFGDTLKDVFLRLSDENQKIITSYISYCRKDAGETTLRKYWGKIVQFADVVEKPLSKLTMKDVIGFLSVLNTSNRTTDSKNDIKKVVKRFIKWKYEGKKEFFKIDKEIKQKRRGSSERISKKDLLTAEELELIMRKTDSLKWKAFVMFMYETGCRPEECYKLKWADLDFQAKEVVLNSAKTGEQRPIPLDQSIIHLRRYYQEYPFLDVKNSDYIFPSSKREKPISNQIVSLFMKKLSKKIDKKVFAYLFRHTRLQEIRPKLSIEAYEKIAGHSIETALRHYGHLDTEDAGREMKAFVYNIKEISPQEKVQYEEMKKEIMELKEMFSPEVLKLLKKLNELNSKKLEIVELPAKNK